MEQVTKSKYGFLLPNSLGLLEQNMPQVTSTLWVLFQRESYACLGHGWKQPTLGSPVASLLLILQAKHWPDTS